MHTPYNWIEKQVKNEYMQLLQLKTAYYTFYICYRKEDNINY